MEPPTAQMGAASLSDSTHPGSRGGEGGGGGRGGTAANGREHGSFGELRRQQGAGAGSRVGDVDEEDGFSPSRHAMHVRWGDLKPAGFESPNPALNRKLRTSSSRTSQSETSNRSASSRSRSMSGSGSITGGESMSSASSYSSVDAPRPPELDQLNSAGSRDFCVANIALAPFGEKEIALAFAKMRPLLDIVKRYTGIERNHSGLIVKGGGGDYAAGLNHHSNNGHAYGTGNMSSSSSSVGDSSWYPLQGANILLCSHVNSYTAVLVEALTDLGASVRWCACNIYSTDDEVAAAMAERGFPVFAWKGQTEEEFWYCIERSIDPSAYLDSVGGMSSDDGGGSGAGMTCSNSNMNWAPTIVLDDGSDATGLLLKKYRDKAYKLSAIVEQSVSGVHSLQKLLDTGKLHHPVMKIHDCVTKSTMDNYVCSRGALVEALKRSTGLVFAGKTVVVMGYGSIGRGCCEALKGLNSIVYVVEVDPICAFQACLHGFQVVRIEEIVKQADLFVTATGCVKVLRRQHMEKMKRDAIVCNIGHYDSEIDVESLRTEDLTWENLHPFVDRISWPDGRFINLLAEGRLINTTCTEGSTHIAASVTCTILLLASIEINGSKRHHEPGIFPLPKSVDEETARLHLSGFNGRLTTLSDEQCSYLGISKSGPFKPFNYRYN
eukprot:Nk52_evm26s2152 gene=Nk52_evmTU26s2152